MSLGWPLVRTMFAFARRSPKDRIEMPGCRVKGETVALLSDQFRELVQEFNSFGDYALLAYIYFFLYQLPPINPCTSVRHQVEIRNPASNTRDMAERQPRKERRRTGPS